MPRGYSEYRPCDDWWQRSAATTAMEAVKPAPYVALTDEEVARILAGLGKSAEPTLDDVTAKVCGDVLQTVGA